MISKKGKLKLIYISLLKNGVFPHFFASVFSLICELNFLLFLKTGRSYCSGWLVAFTDSQPLGDTDQTSCPPVSPLPYTLHLEDNAPLSRRGTPSPTYRAGPVRLNHSFEPPTGFSLQARSAISSGFYISVGGSVFIFSLAIGSLFK